jgi:hypothetical protein
MRLMFDLLYFWVIQYKRLGPKGRLNVAKLTLSHIIKYLKSLNFTFANVTCVRCAFAVAIARRFLPNFLEGYCMELLHLFRQLVTMQRKRRLNFARAWTAAPAR